MPASLEVARTRHAAHYASVMEALRDEYLAVADRDHALDRLELDWEQIRVAQSWAAGLGPAGTDGDVDLARRFGQYADPLVRLRHRPDVLRAWLAPLVADDVASRDPATAAENLNRIGMAHYDSGEYAQARAAWLRALATHRRLGPDADPRYLAAQEAGYQANVGSAEERLGDRGSAREAYERALEVFRRVGLTQQVGRMWLNLGTLLDAEDAHDEAIEAYRRAAEIAKEADDADGVELAYGAWGNSLAETQRLPEARVLLEQALALARALGDRARTALRLGNLAKVTLAEGDSDAALPLRSEALTLAGEMGDPRTEALQLHGMGQVLAARGEEDQAVTFFAGAERIFGEIGMREAAGRSRAAGSAAAARRTLRSAVAAFQELIGAGRVEDAVAALDRWGALGHEPTTAQRSLLLGLYGFADHAAGRLDAAAERYTAALRLDDGLPPSELTAGHRGNLGDLYRQLGDAEQAELAYRAALAVPDVGEALRERFRRGLELARELRDDPGRTGVDPGQEREAGAP